MLRSVLTFSRFLYNSLPGRNPPTLWRSTEGARGPSGPLPTGGDPSVPIPPGMTQGGRSGRSPADTRRPGWGSPSRPLP